MHVAMVPTPRRGEPRAPLRELGRWSSLDDETRSSLADRSIDALIDPALRASVCALLDDVKARGDAALVDALATHDGCRVPADGLRVSSDELDRGLAATSPEVVAALEDAIAHVRRFNEEVCTRGSWSFEPEPGLRLGERVTPIESAGLFVPSGKGSFPSVLVQLAVPALVAGVPVLEVVVPPVPGGGGDVDPAVLAACRLLDLDAVFRLNGPSGIGALAFGTESVGKVRLVVGPGSPAVTCAQLEVQRHGTVTSMVLGPTESLVLADGTASPDLVAADLLNEAEHGSDSTSLLVTTSSDLVRDVQAALATRLAALPEPRRAYAADALGVHGGAVLVDDLDEAALVANAFAPEHLLVVVAEPDRVVDQLVHAGEILIGPFAPFSSANYLLGCPASLPTSGFAKVSSGITAETFRKRTGVASVTAEALGRVRGSVLALARHEGFPAHEQAVLARDA